MYFVVQSSVRQRKGLMGIIKDIMMVRRWYSVELKEIKKLANALNDTATCILLAVSNETDVGSYSCN